MSLRGTLSAVTPASFRRLASFGLLRHILNRVASWESCLNTPESNQDKTQKAIIHSRIIAKNVCVHGIYGLDIQKSKENSTAL